MPRTIRTLAPALLLTAVGLTACQPLETMDLAQLEVLDRHTDDRSLRYTLAEPFAASDLAQVDVSVEATGPDAQLARIVTRDVPARAHLEDDGRELVLELDEAVVPGSVYAAHLGERHLGEVLAHGIAPRTGGFHVAEVTPGYDAVVGRELYSVGVRFAGGTLDCERTLALARPFWLYPSRPPEADGTYELYEDPEARQPGDYYYRGHLECDGPGGWLHFRLPAPNQLLGRTSYVVRVTGVDSTGTLAPLHVSHFSTVSPGLVVTLNQVTHDMTKKCDNALSDSKKRCDVYLIVNPILPGAGSTPAEQPGFLVPAAGDWDDWSASKTQLPNVELLRTGGPVPDNFVINVTAMDHDSGDRAKNILKATGASLAAVGGAVTTLGQPIVGAVVVAGGAIVTAIGAALQSNADDHLGTLAILLEADDQSVADPTVPSERDRYSVWRHPTEWRDTSYGFPYVLPTNKGGNITLRVKVAELPASWRAHLRVIID